MLIVQLSDIALICKHKRITFCCKS